MEDLLRRMPVNCHWKFHCGDCFQRMLKMACRMKRDLLSFSCRVSFIFHVIFNKC